MNSKALTTSLGVVAVLLTTAGIAAPQVLYAREASNFHELAAEVNAVSENAAMLSVQAESEELLLELRSVEVHGLPAKLNALAKSADGPLTPEFKTQLAGAAEVLADAVAAEKVPKGHAEAATKALAAREAEEPDPQTWFDVEPELLAFYADISAEGVERVDTTGTVTLERVQQTKRLHAENVELSEERAESTARLADENAALSEAIAAIETLTTAEASRVATATLKELDERDAEAELAGIDPELNRLEETEQLRAVATELQKRTAANVFVLDAAGKVIGYPEGAEPAEGTVRIPGGPVVQMRYVLPKLQKFLTAYTVEREAFEAANPEPVEVIEEPGVTEQFPGGEVAPDPGAGIVAPPPAPGGGGGGTPPVIVQPQPTPTPTPTPDPEPDPGATEPPLTEG